MEELTYAEAIERLNHIDAFRIVLDELTSDCEQLIDDLGSVPADLLQLHAGKISAYRDVLAILSGR